MRRSRIAIPALMLIIASNCYIYASANNDRPSHFKQPVNLLQDKKTQKTPAAAPKTASNKPAAKPSTAIKPQDIEKGKNLIAQSDCLACHKVDVKVVGPAYNDVAEKYPANKANIEKLAGKVISGGAGVWGQIPMSPHPALSVEDAKSMVQYVLSLKKK